MPRLPQNNIFKQYNKSDKFGDIWSSYNLDLVQNQGSIKVSPRMLLNVSDTDLVNLGVPCAFRPFNITAIGNLWAIAGTRVFVSSAGANTTFTADILTSGSTPTDMGSDYSDIEEMNTILYFSGASTSMYKLSAAGAWSTFPAFVSGATSVFDIHPMVYFRAKDRLYFIDDVGKSIGSLLAGSDTEAVLGAQYTLDDLAEGNEVITWIDATSDSIWIGTMNFAGTSSKVYKWNGDTLNTVDAYYTIEAPGSLACLIVDDVPVILDTRGRLLQLNGGTFKELDRLPFRKDSPITYKAAATLRLCHYNGMELIDGKINILVNTALYDTNGTNKENVPSGIWEYTPETGLYHKASLGHTKAAGTIVDYGQQKLSAVGALQEIDNFLATTYNGKYLAGATYYTTATATLKGLFYDDTNDTLQKAGTFITSKIFSENITDTWQKIYLRFRKFLNATDKIVVKYRMTENEPTEATITYVNTTSFTVLASAFTTNPVVGDEVEILQGVGAGRCTHITAVTGTTTLTITVDETITGATTQTAKARFQTWKKMGTYNSQSDEIFKLPITEGNTSVWIQFKVWILWTGKNELYDVIISNAVNEKIE